MWKEDYEKSEGWIHENENELDGRFLFEARKEFMGSHNFFSEFRGGNEKHNTNM